ncbi:hypothetical protein [Tautonia sociabilis]|uniref:BBC1/AIM3 cysteine proteinase-fold domain-containing protein n=1 Tax=Tautonia sociabilis TaxID=2080755 RepID=A0A432MI49_9BACT|nr:hypothetical protein [Tautonia sociabilis]RUL87054.1 hypothetical protein TsocGM_14020 [Tautonia sociabilis]
MPVAASIILVGLLCLERAPVASKIVAFAEQAIGREVGGGECTDLVAEAFRSAGVHPAPVGIWGEPVQELASLRPGDILRFEQAEFRGRSRSGGRNRRWRLQFDEHVAIVSRAEARGGSVLVEFLHQNFHMDGQPEAEGRVVRRMVLDLGRLTRGTVQAFRPSSGGATPPLPLPSGWPRD